jgi:hypothetical protein
MMRFLITIAMLIAAPALAQQSDITINFPNERRMGVLLDKCEAKPGCEVLSRSDATLRATIRVDSPAVLDDFHCLKLRCTTE